MFLQRFGAQPAWKEAVFLGYHTQKALLIHARFKRSHSRSIFSHTENTKVLSAR